jgi:hypothetical protein
MGMESLKKAKNVIRAAVLGSSVLAGAAATEKALEINNAEAQTTQINRGNNGVNIVGNGNVVDMGKNTTIVTPNGNVVRGDNLKPHIYVSPDGSIRQESYGENNINIIDRKSRQ